MFAEVKAMLTFVNGDEYDEKIAREINACAVDLTKTAEIILPGDVKITVTRTPATTSEPESVTITDESDIDDDYVFAVFATWCDMRLGNPPNYDNLLAAYKTMKGNMRLSKEYTTFGGAEE